MTIDVGRVIFRRAFAGAIGRRLCVLELQISAFGSLTVMATIVVQERTRHTIAWPALFDIV